MDSYFISLSGDFVLFLQEKEFLKMFQMPVIEVPTNLPNIRKDLPIQAFAVCSCSLLCIIMACLSFHEFPYLKFKHFLDCSREMGVCSR